MQYSTENTSRYDTIVCKESQNNDRKFARKCPFLHSYTAYANLVNCFDSLDFARSSIVSWSDVRSHVYKTCLYQVDFNTANYEGHFCYVNDNIFY